MLDIAHLVNLVPHRGRLIAPQVFFLQHNHLLSKLEQQTASQMRQSLAKHTQGYPFELPMSIAAIVGGQGISVQAEGARCATLAEIGLYIKGCRPAQASGFLSAENVVRELLAYLVFSQHDWPTARIPVAVLEYQHGHNNSFALAFTLVPDYCPIETLFVEQNLPLERLVAEPMPPSHRLMQHSLPDYLAKKAGLLATTHAKGLFRGCDNAVAANDLYSCSRKITTIVGFEYVQLLQMSASLPVEKRIALVCRAFIEAALSMLPTRRFVWVDGLSDETSMALIEQAALQNGWMEQYSLCLTEQLIACGWGKEDICAGYGQAREHPKYRSALEQSVISSHSLATPHH